MKTCSLNVAKDFGQNNYVYKFLLKLFKNDGNAFGFEHFCSHN